jgi:hypothetical protein
VSTAALAGDGLWGVGTFATSDGATPFPVSVADHDADIAAAGRALDSLGIGRGDRVLIVGLVSECVQLVPFHEALRRRGAILSGADATPFDAPRTAKLARQLDARAVLAVNGAVVDGLITEGFDLAEVFGPVPLVGARPDAVARLRAAGVQPIVWAHVGPAVAVECRPGAGAHVDEALWDVTERDGTVMISARSPRAVAPGPHPTGVHAALARGQCPCGRSDVRLMDLGTP